MEKRTNMKLSTRLILLLFLMGLGLVVASVASAFTLLNINSLLPMVAVQDVFAFILPAIVGMAIFYRRPLHAMLVDANEAMTLPSWMGGLEQWMRSSEDAAMDATKQMLDIHSIGELIICVLVVGFMAGLSEEMLFRGAMQRTMQDSRLGTHAVVWIVAIIFSAIHFQFYGFVPRVVLGLWLGYLLVWTRSLWVPIIAHTLNNSTVVVFSYLANLGIVPEGYGDNLGLPADGGMPWLAICSFVACLALAVWAHRYFTKGKRLAA